MSCGLDGSSMFSLSIIFSFSSYQTSSRLQCYLQKNCKLLLCESLLPWSCQWLFEDLLSNKKKTTTWKTRACLSTIKSTRLFFIECCNMGLVAFYRQENFHVENLSMISMRARTVKKDLFSWFRKEEESRNKRPSPLTLNTESRLF